MEENKSILRYDPQAYNLSLAKALKDIPEFVVPDFVHFVKSGASRERPIENADEFWFMRSASILRQIYKNKIVGVNRFRTRYGGKKNRGMRPETFRKSSGKIIRTILQQCDKAGFTEIKKGKKEKSGRKLTTKGKDFLENVKIIEVKKEIKDFSKEKKAENIKVNEEQGDK
ncbi:30S ribosomal protein S19e [Candidatus Pacearchaeota archaeon CG10_big_fil_rev_8_21_14_0_10_32_14]|nr:MAG: 30S ribosomal protein S19e [Candidatus Pacearchaeota archaeon CG10_big_fil_rev_8_21_14_0_10_32_14]